MIFYFWHSNHLLFKLWSDTIIVKLINIFVVFWEIIIFISAIIIFIIIIIMIIIMATQGAPKVGNSLLSREGVLNIIITMADSQDPLYAVGDLIQIEKT